MRRLIHILIGVLVGLATGLGVWFLSGGNSQSDERIQTVAASLPSSRLMIAPAMPSTSFVSVGEMASNPIFYALTKAAQDRKTPSITVQGISLTRIRAAALVSIDGGPAHWMAKNDEEAGLTLTQVTPQKAVFESELGPIEVVLGGAAAAGQGPEIATQAPTMMKNDQVPAGMRSPPPPASAPASK